MNDLKEGMKIEGVVRNVTDFGAFVDISVHQDGLLHISEISDSFIKHPSDRLKVGDKVTVWVLSVDTQKHRIALTMLDPATRDARKAEYEKQKQQRQEQKAAREKSHAEYLERKAAREKSHAEYLERQAAREKRQKGAEERAARGEAPERRERFERGERRDRGDRPPRREGFVSGYRDRQDENVPDTQHMTMEQKLAALAGKFNKK